jgi:hypothetical protein
LQTDRDSPSTISGGSDGVTADESGTAAAEGRPPSPPPAADLSVGDRVRLAAIPAYLKTADPMPMLRPPDLVDPAETGLVVELRSMGMVAVRFRRGTFLIAADQLSPAES